MTLLHPDGWPQTSPQPLQDQSPAWMSTAPPSRGPGGQTSTPEELRPRGAGRGRRALPTKRTDVRRLPSTLCACQCDGPPAQRQWRGTPHGGHTQREGQRLYFR